MQCTTQFSSKLLLSLFAGLLSLQATAGPECTQEPQEKWQSVEAFKEKMQRDGYEVKRYKITSGNCYEIYGWNKKGQKVEIYFHPISGEIIKQEIDD